MQQCLSTCHVISPVSITFELILQSQSYTIDARLTNILNLSELNPSKDRLSTRLH